MTTAKKTSNLVTELYEHKGLSALITFREDGWINMTKAAKHFKKQLQNFWNSPETDAYLNSMAELIGIQCFETKKGRYGGSWCHPKLAVFFARWLDVRFAVWCDLMIDNILKGHLQVEVAVPTLEAQKLKSELGFCVAYGTLAG